MINTETFGTPQGCSYSIHNDWNQPLGRISEYLNPFEIPPSYYVEAKGIQLVSSGLIGIEHNDKFVDEMFPFGHLPKKRQLELFEMSCLPPSHYFESTLCSLISPLGWHNSYYHWFMDYLPMVLAAEKYYALTGDPFKVLVPVNLKAWQLQSLSKLGYQEGSLIKFKPCGDYINVRTQRIIVSHSHRWQRNPEVPRDAISPNTFVELKKRLKPGKSEAESSSLPKKIYLSRKDASSRRLVNEDEIFSLLSNYGFESVTLEGVNLRTQVKLFRGATHIVAVHGAGLTNLLHSYHASVLEIHSLDHGIRPDFFQIALLNKCRYFFYVCNSRGVAKDVYMNASVIKKFLEATL